MLVMRLSCRQAQPGEVFELPSGRRVRVVHIQLKGECYSCVYLMDSGLPMRGKDAAISLSIEFIAERAKRVSA